MQVNTYGFEYNKYTSLTYKTKATSTFSIDDNQSETPEDVFSYYQNLCKEFKGISFRLDDVNEAAKHVGSVYLGYNNSHNQVGNNFGNRGQCSITLDVSVIEQMQKDPSYEERVKGMIQNSYNRYSEYESKALEDGYSFLSLMIEDNNGIPTRSVQQSNVPYSTEEEVNNIWDNQDITRKMSINIEEQKKSLFDAYMKMFDESQKRRLELHFVHKPVNV